MDDARAKIRLSDGREVWRQVKVEYREVDTGRWVSSEEVEKLCPASWNLDTSKLSGKIIQPDQLRQQIVDVQAQIALDSQGGAKSTSAARLVLKALDEMQAEDQGEQSMPWFILGRNLAEEILLLLENSPDEETGKN